MGFEETWAGLSGIGRDPAGGVTRVAFGPAEAQLRSWFRHQAGRRGFRVLNDRFGNLAATWRVPMLQFTSEVPATPVAVGSHLDSSVGGGEYDGVLGLASAFAAIDLLRERGFAPTRPVMLIAFAAQTGSRFGVECLGSQLACGQLSFDQVADLTDVDGVSLAEALAEADACGEDVIELVDAVSAFVELHIESGRELADREFPIALASRAWARARYRLEFDGESAHAAAQPMEGRRDPMLTYATTVLAASKLARRGGHRVGFGEVEVSPGLAEVTAQRVTASLDLRTETNSGLVELVNQVIAAAQARAERDGTTVSFRGEAVTPAEEFDPILAGWLAGDHLEGDWPLLSTAAGHDAGVLSAAGVPSAVVLVRNPGRPADSTADHVEPADRLLGVEALADTLARLAC